MRSALRIVLATSGALLLWTLVAGTALLEGWGRPALAPRGDTRALMAALTREVEASRAGNLGLALIEGGSVHAEHMSSVAEPIDRDSVFQVASLSKWVSAWGVLTLVESGDLELDTPVSAT